MRTTHKLASMYCTLPDKIHNFASCQSGQTHHLLRCFPDTIILNDSFVQGVEQVRGPHHVWSLRWDFCNPSTEDPVQHFDLCQVRAESLEHCRQSDGLICKTDQHIKHWFTHVAALSTYNAMTFLIQHHEETHACFNADVCKTWRFQKCYR